LGTTESNYFLEQKHKLSRGGEEKSSSRSCCFSDRGIAAAFGPNLRY